MVCTALYPADGKWYRAKIVDLPGCEMVKVFFVDFGDEEYLSWRCVRKLLPDFIKLAPQVGGHRTSNEIVYFSWLSKWRFQALRCSLSKVLHSSDLKWDSGTKAYLENSTSDIFTVHIASVTDDELKVVLITEDNVCLNAELACIESAGDESS